MIKLENALHTALIAAPASTSFTVETRRPRAEEDCERRSDGRADAEENGGGRSKRSARRDAENVGIGERVLYNRLHDDAADRESRADGDGEEKARQAQEPNNVVYRTFTRRVDGRAARELCADRAPNGLCGQMHRTDAERPEDRRAEQQEEQETDAEHAPFLKKVPHIFYSL